MLKKSLSDNVSSIELIVCFAISSRWPSIEPDKSNKIKTFFDIVAASINLN